MKHLVHSAYSSVVGMILSAFDYLIAIAGAKRSDTVSFPSPGRALAKKSQFEFITEGFLDESGRVRDSVSVDRLCPVCSAGNSSHFCYSQDGFEYVICGNCSMIYTSKILTPKAYRAFQAKLLDSEKLWVAEREEDKSADKRRFSFYIGCLKKHVRAEGELLDVGCFTGSFLELAQEAGFGASGVEIHQDKASIAASKGFPVRCGDFEELDIGATYQVVTLWESLEHMNHPRLAVQKARNILYNGGIIAFTVPNGDALSVKVLNGHLMWLGGFGHKNLFTPSAAAYLLEDCGFDPIELKTMGGPYMDAIISYFQNRIDSMDSFQNWDRLNSGVHRPSGARLWEILVSPIVEHYNMGDMLLAIGRKP